jgi:hypothetical protein
LNHQVSDKQKCGGVSAAAQSQGNGLLHLNAALRLL